MRSKSILVVAIVLFCVGLPKAESTVNFNDGKPHNINDEINDEVQVDYLSPGVQTTVNWLTGASIPYPYVLSVYEDGRLNIYDGSIGRDLFAHDRSQVNISGGSINDFVAVSDSSRINISGGAIAWEFYAENSSRVDISGGSIGDYLVATDSSYIDISGGSIDNYLGALESSQVTISGGSIGQYLWAEGGQVKVFGGAIGGELRASWLGGIITIYGWDFAVDGQPFGYGELSSIFGTDYRDEPFRHLTGTLASGELIDNDFRIGHNAKIVLVPEPQTYYVDADAPGANDGTSWADAFNYLQDALTAARSADEIWVAQGTYTPDSNTANPTGTGDRRATFQLKNAVAVKGSYAGYGEPDPNARDIELYKTILSGDLAGNDIQVDPCDLLDEPTRAENSYHVVTASGTDETAVLDGFIITAGNANGSSPDVRGGGMCNDDDGSPTVTNCTFNGNSASSQGGGMHNSGSSIITNCRFIANSTGTMGGGMSVHDWATVTNCVFIGNSAAHGGGCFGTDSFETFTNCIFSGNKAHSGGGWFSIDSDATFINCTFSGNKASNSGGGIGNSSDYSLTLTNCILWGNTPDDINTKHCLLFVNHCCIPGSWQGIGNINIAPCFADPTNGDYHLLPGSPCIDTGDPNYIAEPNETDLDGNPRVTGGRIDMGAYEFSSIEARLWLFPQVINRHSRMKAIMAWVHLPENVTEDQIDTDQPVLLYPGAIEPVRQNVFQHGKRGDKGVSIFAFYNKAELMAAVPDNGPVDLEVIGSLTTGQYFHGSDTLRIIGRRWHRWWRR